jgi:PAS domain-containing protein
LEKRVEERTAQLKLANEELRESEKRFRSLFEQATEGIFLAAFWGMRN